MNDRDTLFREEALEFRSRARTISGTVVRLDAPWIRWLYRLSLVLLAAGVVLTLVMRMATTATGAAMVDTDAMTFSALVPAVVAPDLRTAEEMTIDLDAVGAPTLVARVTKAAAVEPGASTAGLAPAEQPSILLTGVVTSTDEGATLPRGRRLGGRATVVLRSERVADFVLRQLGGMFGERGATS